MNSLAYGRRIVVVGATASGKTTLAKKLSHHLRVPHIELDALHIDPHWSPAPVAVFRQRILEAMKADAWIMDGGYPQVYDLYWSQAEMLLWLDYPLSIVVSRVLKRSFRRIITKEELWNGNREGLHQFFSRGSSLLWALRTYWRDRRVYPVLLCQPEHAHLQVVRLRSPGAARKWLSGFLSIKAPLD